MPTHPLVLATPQSPPSPLADAAAPTLSPLINTVALATQRDEKRAREQRSRRRRTEKLQQMRDHVRTMEQVALSLPLVHDADEIWDGFLGSDTKRVRAQLRLLQPTTHEIKMLLAEKRQLHRLLVEHELAHAAMNRLLVATRQDERDKQVRRWKTLAKEHFRPWTQAQCAAVLQDAMAEMDRFTYSRDTQTSGMSMRGWHESRRVDKETASFQFSIHKTFRDYDLDYYLDATWRVYRDGDLCTMVLLDRRGAAAIDILQELTPRLAVVLYHERYEGVDMNIHSLNLIATVETTDRVTQFIRTIDAPELVRVLNRPDDMWVSRFYWKQFDILDRNKPRHATDFCVSLRGTVRGNDVAYLNRCMLEVLGTVLRDEVYSSGRKVLACA